MNLCRAGLHEMTPENRTVGGTCRKCKNVRVLESRGKGPIPAGDLTPEWLDPVAVERALRGLDVGRPLHAAEMREVNKYRSTGASYDSVRRIVALRKARNS